jgi:uncharacterized protein (TIGR02001 family)
MRFPGSDWMKVTLLVLFSWGTLSNASAQTITNVSSSPVSITWTVGVDSDYRFRGIAQNNFKPSLQAGLDLSTHPGFYLGIWSAKVSEWAASHDGFVELDTYAGYKNTVGKLGFDVGVIAYTYPRSISSYNANTRETYLGLSYGIISFKTSYVLSKNYFASTNANDDASGTLYYDLTLSKDVAKRVNVFAHVGYTDYKNKQVPAYETENPLSYTDYNVGFNFESNGFTLTAKYFWNDTHKGTRAWTGLSALTDQTKLYRSGFGFSITKSF